MGLNAFTRSQTNTQEKRKDDEITYYFRGTTRGFAGGTPAQRLGVTSTSTQPGVATVFATVAETLNGGQGVVYIVSSHDMAGINIGAANWLNELEQEVVFDILPLDFAELATDSVSAARARQILAAMGRYIPPRVTLQMQNLALSGLIPLTKQEIEAFVQAARSNS